MSPEQLIESYLEQLSEEELEEYRRWHLEDASKEDSEKFKEWYLEKFNRIDASEVKEQYLEELGKGKFKELDVNFEKFKEIFIGFGKLVFVELRKQGYSMKFRKQVLNRLLDEQVFEVINRWLVGELNEDQLLNGLSDWIVGTQDKDKVTFQLSKVILRYVLTTMKMATFGLNHKLNKQILQDIEDLRNFPNLLLTNPGEKEGCNVKAIFNLLSNQPELINENVRPFLNFCLWCLGRVHKVLVKEDIQHLKTFLSWLDNEYTNFMRKHVEAESFNHLGINEQLTQDANVKLREKIFKWLRLSWLDVVMIIVIPFFCFFESCCISIKTLTQMIKFEYSSWKNSWISFQSTLTYLT